MPAQPVRSARAPLPGATDTLEELVLRSHFERPSLRRRFLQEMESARVGEGKLSGEGDMSEGNTFDDWFFRNRAYPVGYIPVGARAKALADAQKNNGALHGAPGDLAPPPIPPPLPTWIPLGPSTIPNGQTDTTVGPANPVSGRLTAIAVHPTNPDVVYAGGAQGGIWKTTNATSGAPTWVPVTDHQASLAIGAIAIDPTNPNILYVGTGEPNGSCDSYYGQGILRSADGGFSWTLLDGGGGSPFNNPGPFAGKTVSRIFIDPATAGSTTSTTLWAGTTSGVTSSGTTASCASPSGASRGVWKSTDSGATWTIQTAATGLLSVKDLALDPTDHDVLYAAVSASGVWKSTNAATGSPSTYTLLAGGWPTAATASPSYSRITLGIGGPGAHNTLYAALQASNQRLWGMFKTTDGGATWSHLDGGNNGTASVTNGSTSVVRVSGPSFVSDWSTVALGGPTDHQGRRIIINNRSHTVNTIVDGDHLTLTASFTGATAAAAAWSVATYPNYCEGQCFYDMTVAVDPADATGNTVYIGGNPNAFFPDLAGVTTAHTNWRSDDGGVTWRSISQGSAATGGLHTDDHVYAFDTTSGTFPSPVLDGNDGGIWRSSNQGTSWTTMNTNIAITQFSGVSTHPTNPAIVLGGTQDNGTNLLNSALEPPPSWFHADFGDGGQSLIDQTTPLRMFHTYFNQTNNLLGPAKVTDGGVNGPGSWDFVGAYAGYGPQYYNGIGVSEPVAFYAPLTQFVGTSPNAVYFGTSKVYRAADPVSPFNHVASWTVKSPALGKTAGAALAWISVFPALISGKEVVYVGAADGRVQVSADVDGTAAVPTWTILDKAPLPNRAINYVVVSPNDATANTAYVAFSGFNVATPTTPGHVFLTTNGLAGAAASWTDVSGDLPDVPVTALAVEPGSPERIYAGTDIGMFRSLNGGAHWSYLSEGFPVVVVFGLERNASTGQIVASTHGRGMFQLNATDVTPPVCGGSVTNANRFDGAATDQAPGDTGIASVQLQAGSTNLVIASITYLSPTSVTYVVTTINHCLPGTGTVVVSDYNGNTCSTPVSLAGDPSPSAVITAPATVCSHSTTNVASVPDAGPGATYVWTISGGTITAGAGTSSITFSAGASGPITLGVTVTTAAGCSATGTASVIVSATCGNFFTLAPCRVIDTRLGEAPSLVAGGTRTFFLTGSCGVPSSAQSLSVNVAVTNEAAGGTVQIYAGGTAAPTPSAIYYNTGQTRANNAIVTLGPGGSITVQCNQASGTTDLILDINGYFE